MPELCVVGVVVVVVVVVVEVEFSFFGVVSHLFFLRASAQRATKLTLLFFLRAS